MIPLMYILPSDSVYTPVTGIITRITPNYNNYRNSIQIEFKYNLDDFFYLEITLNEFDQPSSVSLYGYYNSQTVSVDDNVEKYHLIGKKVSIILKKDLILEIINNIVSTKSFKEGSIISFDTIQDKQKIEDRAILSEVVVSPISVELTINNVEYIYEIGTKETLFVPVLINGNVEEKPSSIDGHYNIFPLDGNNAGLSLVIIPTQDIINHYLFRENERLTHTEITPSKEVSVSGNRYFYNNGMIENMGQVISMQKFLVNKKDDDYKTYIFNAARDNNLYTEITLLFPAVQHNSMTVYNFDESILIKGKADYFSMIDGETDRILFCLRLSNCMDFFGRKIDKTYEFRFDQGKVLTEDISKVKNSTLVGTLYISDNKTGNIDVIPTDSKHIDLQKDGYMTSSNNGYSISIKRETLVRKSELMRGEYINFKAVTSNDYIAPLFKFDTVDFARNTITVVNGTIVREYELSEKNLVSISSGDSCFKSKDQMSNFAGISFEISPDIITVSGINITNFSDYVMLCRMVEEPSYGIPGIRRDTDDLVHSLTLTFDMVDITIIYNMVLDKIYYINFDKKETVTSSDDMPYIFSKYISSIDENKLKNFLLNGGTSMMKTVGDANSSLITMENNLMYFEEVINERYFDSNNNIALISSSSKGITTFDNLTDNKAISGVYIPRQSKIDVLKNSFGSSVFTYREVFTGVYANKSIDITEASISDSVFSIVFTHEDDTHTVSISLDGGPIEIKNSLKEEIVTKAESYSTATAYTYNSTVDYDKIYQKYGVIVAESSFDVGIAFNINILELMKVRNTIGINKALSISHGEKMFLIGGINSNKVSISKDILKCKDINLDLLSPTGKAKALSFNGKNGDFSTTISKEEYDKLLTKWGSAELDYNGFISIDEFNNDTYAIAYDITKAQYLQFKEN